MKQSSHPKTGMSPEYAEFDGSPVTQVFEWGRHDWFYSDAYRTAANIGLDYAWFHKDVGQTQAVSRLQYTLGVVNKENPYMTYEVDGTVLDQEALHPVGLLATTAQGSLAVLKETSQSDAAEHSEEVSLALWWVKKFWETPLRTGKRRYYDNCLYMFAFLALAGIYQIW
jgi:oligosaccharide reducing-end xylanase